MAKIIFLHLFHFEIQSIPAQRAKICREGSDMAAIDEFVEKRLQVCTHPLRFSGR